MCKLVLDRGSIAEFTSVSNIFMDEYMPRANGEFIKIYLHLLRLVNSNNDIADELTTERIADKFNMLESDVIRALNYWAEQNLITLSYNSQNEISGITLESILRNRYIVKGITSTETNLLASASGQSESIPVPESRNVPSAINSVLIVLITRFNSESSQWIPICFDSFACSASSQSSFPMDTESISPGVFI